MNLKKVELCGFKSFQNKTNIYIDNLTAIIGANSSGKTSFFQALLRMFGESGQDREIKKSDFFFPNKENPDNIDSREMYIETEFEFDEIEEKNGIKQYSIPDFIEHFVIKKDNQDPNKQIPYVRIRLEASWKKSNQPEGIVERDIFFVVTNEEKFENKDKHHISNEILSKIKFIYVPAVRNPHVQLKNVAGSILWRLLNGINLDDKFKNEVNDKIKEVNAKIQEHNGIHKIKEILEKQWEKYHTDNRYKNVEFIFNTSDINSILKKIEPSFTPTETGNPYNVDEIGDGLKSLFYFSLVATLLKAEAETLKEITAKPDELKDNRIFSFEPPYVTILGVEEPENHISPYILGKIVKNLDDISKNSNSQVILSSHSPSIVKRIDPENIRYFNIDKSKGVSTVNKIELPDKDEEAFKYVKEAVQAYPELYFANLVILGEGDSEEVVIPKILEANGIDIISNEIAIVPLGGRHVNHFWKLLKQLDIPYITLLDLDVERDGGGFGRIKYAIEQLIENGYDSDELLEVKDGIMSEDKFKKMHTWNAFDPDGTLNILNGWVNFLELYGVFYSNPIDLDFMMLQCFENEYKSILNDDKSKGPKIVINGEKVYIKDITKGQMNSAEYKAKLKTAIHATLKSENKDGEKFSDEEKNLMVWYNYFFLYRGKPVMHRLAMSKIDEDKLRNDMPQVFKNMCDKVKKMLEGGK